MSATRLLLTYEHNIARTVSGRKATDRSLSRSGRLGLDFGLFGDLKRVIDFDAQVTDRAFQLGMAKQQLDRS